MWLALSGNGWSDSKATCKDFQTYLSAFRCSKLDGNPNTWNDVVEDMIRPMFSNLHKSPVPQFGQFREYPLNFKIPVLMGPSWNKTFALRTSDLFEVPLFNGKGYQAWRKFYWPIV